MNRGDNDWLLIFLMMAVVGLGLVFFGMMIEIIHQLS